jgi:hypothetical protein
MMKRKKVKLKNPHAVLLGSLGGQARAKKLTAEERSRIAKMGGRPRKKKEEGK